MTVTRSVWTGNYIASQKFGNTTLIAVHRLRLVAMQRLTAKFLLTFKWVKYLQGETV